MAGSRLLSHSATLVMLISNDCKPFSVTCCCVERRCQAFSWSKLQAGLKLLKISLATSFLVVLAGDVSLNPGPETDPCALCTKGCWKSQRAVQCDECDCWFHAKCINMNHREYLDISDLAAYRSCMDCLFPRPFSASNVSYDPKTSTSNDSINAPKVRLVRGLKIAHLNVNRLVNKLDGVRKLMSTYNFDVPTQSETWLSSNISDCEHTIPGYTLVRKDRNWLTKLNGGGVLFYIRDNIPFTVKKDLATNKEELLWVEINRPKCKPLLIAAAYKPPNVKEANFLETLTNSFAKIDLDKNGLVLMGDFNIDQHGKSSASRLLKSFAVVNDMKQLINEPTRITEYSKTLIDLIFTNREHKIVQSDVIHTTLSDHSLGGCITQGGATATRLWTSAGTFTSFMSWGNRNGHPSKTIFHKDLVIISNPNTKQLPSHINKVKLKERGLIIYQFLFNKEWIYIDLKINIESQLSREDIMFEYLNVTFFDSSCLIR